MTDLLALAELLISCKSIGSISKIYRHSVTKKITSSGGSRPSFCARFHLSRRLIPTQGPYFAVISKTRRISVADISDCEETASKHMDQYRESNIGSHASQRTYGAHHYEYRDLHELILIRQTLVSLMPCLE